VLVDQSVTDGFGLVGRVLVVYPTTSTILLTVDPASAVGVRDARSGELLLAKGLGQDGLLATGLDDSVDVKVGDHLSTGPAGKTSYVAGIEVGVVTKVGRAGQELLTAMVKPTAPQSALDLVGIVLAEPRDVGRKPLTPGNAR
jgi:rod shape-determining protein MreC